MKETGRDEKVDFVLEGEICPGTTWKDHKTEPFHIKFQASSIKEAKRVALERIKAFARRFLNRSTARKFLLQKVYLFSEIIRKKLAIKNAFKNNGILFARKPANVFYG